MAELKSKPTKVSVESFIRAIPGEGRRKDCKTLLRIMKGATGAKPVM